MSSNTMKVGKDNFEQEVLKAPEPVVVDFWAPWCGPCKSIGPILEDLSVTYAGKVRVAKVNVDEEPELANVFKVQGIPTLAVLLGGRMLGQVVGFRGRPHLEQLFKELARAGQEPPAAQA
ncbi:MAG: thioredoxin [Deltaproteobacteria bacterium]|nr:thioredoxin [Deltaproteobacteria bacterium]